MQDYFYLGAAILIALTIHEFSHAWMADRLGDPTAKYHGRISLNPLDHLDFMGTVLFFVVHFGWAKPVPVNPNNFKNPVKDSVLVALAGPASNIFLAILISGFLRYFASIDTNCTEYFCALLSTIFYVNITLAVFNFLPFPPLDGSKIIQILIPERYVDGYDRFLDFSSRYFMFFILIDMFFMPNILGTSILGYLIGNGSKFIATVILLGS